MTTDLPGKQSLSKGTPSMSPPVGIEPYERFRVSMKPSDHPAPATTVTPENEVGVAKQHLPKEVASATTDPNSIDSNLFISGFAPPPIGDDVLDEWSSPAQE